MLPLPGILDAKIGKMVETLLLSVLIIAIAMLLLSVRVLLKKGEVSSRNIYMTTSICAKREYIASSTRTGRHGLPTRLIRLWQDALLCITY